MRAPRPASPEPHTHETPSVWSRAEETVRADSPPQPLAHESRPNPETPAPQGPRGEQTSTRPPTGKTPARPKTSVQDLEERHPHVWGPAERRDRAPASGIPCSTREDPPTPFGPTPKNTRSQFQGPPQGRDRIPHSQSSSRDSPPDTLDA